MKSQLEATSNQLCCDSCWHSDEQNLYWLSLVVCGSVAMVAKVAGKCGVDRGFKHELQVESNADAEGVASMGSSL